jgi:NAD(P)-dependent dehydrogenase (short-subunit alcohol dehydrogenase family)
MNTKKVTLVTGAASGIGRATALKLAERGDQLVCTDFASAPLQEMKDLTNGICLGADVTIESEVEALVAATIAEYGRLDGVVHCAGIEESFVDARDMTLEVFEKTMRVNVTGSFLVARAAGRVMVPQGSGSIVLLGSILSSVGYGGNAAYTASKGAVLQLGRALAVDWSKFGVRINIVGPGPVATPMSQASIDDPVRGAWLRERIPLGRPASTDDIAGVCAFLLSDEASYITGTYLPVDGGWLAL